MQLAEAAHDLCNALHPDLCFGGCQVNRAHKCVAHDVILVNQNQFHKELNYGFSVGAAFRLCIFLRAAHAFAVDVACQLLTLELGLQPL